MQGHTAVTVARTMDLGIKRCFLLLYCSVRVKLIPLAVSWHVTRTSPQMILVAMSTASVEAP